MKDLLLPLGLLVVALGVFIFFWAGPQSVSIFPQSGAVASTEATPAPAVAESTPAPKKPVGSQGKKLDPGVPDPPPLPTVRRADQISVVTPSEPVQPEAPPVEEILVKPAVRPPVDPTQITTGMPRSRVIELLGEPTLKTATILDGGMTETFVYTNTTQGDFIRIQIRGGRVVGNQ